MRKPATGEPCAGEPLARFGGRGGPNLPYPYRLLSPIEDLGQNVGGRNKSGHGGEGCARDLHNLGLNKPRRSGRRVRPATAPPKGQSGNPDGRSAKSLPALLADALNETVVMTIDGRRR
jgi:hypothetical protein